MPVSPSKAASIKEDNDENLKQKQYEWLVKKIDEELCEGKRVIKYHEDSPSHHFSLNFIFVSAYELVELLHDTIYQVYRDAGWKLTIKYFDRYHWFVGESKWVELHFEAKK